MPKTKTLHAPHAGFLAVMLALDPKNQVSVSVAKKFYDGFSNSKLSEEHKRQACADLKTRIDELERSEDRHAPAMAKVMRDTRTIIERNYVASTEVAALPDSVGTTEVVTGQSDPRHTQRPMDSASQPRGDVLGPVGEPPAHP